MTDDTKAGWTVADTKTVVITILSYTIAGFLTVWLAGKYIANEAVKIQTASQQKQSISLDSTNVPAKIIETPFIQTENIYVNNNPAISESIVTYEFYNNQWNPVVRHTFYGNTQNDIDKVISSHKITDSFFAASFIGEFNWKGSTIKLRNEISYVNIPQTDTEKVDTTKQRYAKMGMIT